MLAANDLWFEFTGYGRGEVVGKPYASLVPEEYMADFEETWAIFKRDGRLDGRDCHIRLKSGDVRNVLIYGRVGEQDGASVTRCVMVDVTEFRATEYALAESEKRFRTVFDNAPGPIVVHDGRSFIMANAAVARFLGVDSPSDLLGEPIADFVHPDSAPGVIERVKTMMSEGTPSPIVEELFVRKDGSVAYGETAAAPFELDGKRVIYVGATDIEGRRAAENALVESEGRFRSLFEMSPDAIVVHDGETVLLANRAASECFGVSESELIGRKILSLVDPSSHRLVKSRLARLSDEEGALPPVEIRMLCARGGTWESEATSASITMHGRRVYQTTLRDLTERKATEKQLEAYRSELEVLVAERTLSLQRVRAELDSVTAVVGRTVELRDPYTAGHQRRVAELSIAIAACLGMNEIDSDYVRIAAGIHDIGKISVPAEILSKPGRFSAIEYELVKTHAQSGYDIVASAELEGPIAEIVYQHHERLDGSGYPRGLGDSELLPGARVIMVADVVEAMTSHRPYRAALGLEAALHEVTSGAGVLFDADVVRACQSVMLEGFTFTYEV